MNWKKGFVSALALGGPAAAANYGSPRMGSVGTQFGPTVQPIYNSFAVADNLRQSCIPSVTDPWNLSRIMFETSAKLTEITSDKTAVLPFV